MPWGRNWASGTAGGDGGECARYYTWCQLRTPNGRATHDERGLDATMCKFEGEWTKSGFGPESLEWYMRRSYAKVIRKELSILVRIMIKGRSCSRKPSSNEREEPPQDNEVDITLQHTTTALVAEVRWRYDRTVSGARKVVRCSGEGAHYDPIKKIEGTSRHA